MIPRVGSAAGPAEARYSLSLMDESLNTGRPVEDRPVSKAGLVSPIRIRPRISTDLPDLVRLLATQQPATHYPLTWPLPMPVERFLGPRHELVSWVAEGGRHRRLLGHVSVRSMAGGVLDAVQSRAWLYASGRGLGELAEVAALFVGNQVRGQGVGKMLLEQACVWIVGHGLTPCLTVVSDSRNPAASVYQHLGWTVVGRLTPPWLVQPADGLLLMSKFTGCRRPTRSRSS